jgi:hypothetical protein
MRGSSFRLLFLAGPLVAIAACGGPGPSREPDRERGRQVSESASTAVPASADSASRAAGPDVRVTAAPGVAFNYRHSFALEPERIAGVQEQHARACEGLGISRCRITGMHYRRLNEHEIEAQLEFKLDPSLARRFGQAALEQVQQAGGMLVESQITGTDVGTGIRADTRSIEQLSGDLQRIERQLADPGIPSAQKETLRYQAEQLRENIRKFQDSRETQAETLATTPVKLDYGTDDYGTNRPNFARTLRQAGDGFVWGLYGLMVVLVTLSPWIALGALLWLLVRALRRRFRRPAPPAAAIIEG